MNNLYLVRHGQAGPRKAYDALSELGCRQCHLLGVYFASQGIGFDRAYSGELARQRHTAEEVRAGYGGTFPEIVVDCGWNEFDLDRMYRELAPQICAADPEFQREYEGMRQQIRESDESSEVHHRWLPCDSSIVNAWIAAEHKYTGESWQQFRQRIADCQQRTTLGQRGGNVVVFTSATPIAICTALALRLSDERLMSLAGALQNASFSILQIRGETYRMFSFNNTPHLASPDLRTFR